MANFVVAYDLMAPGQHYAKVEAAVKSLGTACKLLNTTWYLKTSSSLEQAHMAIRGVMDQNVLYDDGSLRRLDKVRMHEEDERMTTVPYGMNGGGHGPLDWARIPAQ